MVADNPQPVHVVSEAVGLLQQVESATTPAARQTASEALSPLVQTMKHLLYGFPEQPVDADLSTALASAAWDANLLPLLVVHLPHLEFECRKDVAQVVSSLLRKSSGNRLPTVELFVSDPSLIRSLLAGYETPSIALNCGLMLREAVRHEALCRQLLYMAEFYTLFEHIESALFEVASDAFSTFKDALTKHKPLAAEFLHEQYEPLFAAYTKLLSSGNYVTKRQSLKLLSELLLDRANFKVMTRYISSADDLKLIMLLLRDASKTIQYEAFHVFKIFVANPNRQKPIVDILVRNGNKLVAFLERFQADKEEEQFIDEKNFLIAEVQSLCAEHESTAATDAPAAAGASAGADASADADVRDGIPRADGGGIPRAGGGGIPRAGGGGIPRADGGGIPRAGGGGIPRADGGGIPRADGGGIPRADGGGIPRAGGGGIPRAGGGGIPRADGGGIPRAGGGGIPRADGGGIPRADGGGIPRADGGGIPRAGGGGIPRADGGGIPRADGGGIPRAGGGGIPRADGGGIPRANGEVVHTERAVGSALLGGIPRWGGGGGAIPRSGSGGGGIPRADGSCRAPLGGGIPRASGEASGASGGVPRARGLGDPPTSRPGSEADSG
ncbi:hypothetical protein KFE25_011039 [Diacronema lutheri]|uniref:Uncharacterized protein n=1 Tax=Diacronema lutheri TaxID=2081491 RepID=A0A8J5XB48_DIALT|nr:hypothetical protein KFE25_011039 [Diacronema lutheri]